MKKYVCPSCKKRKENAKSKHCNSCAAYTFIMEKENSMCACGTGQFAAGYKCQYCQAQKVNK
jgi:hypothetical protein